MFLPRIVWLAALLCAAPAFSLCAQETFEAPTFLGDPAGLGKNIQRTMRLLATSTPQKRNTVRILFYGQSITEQAWAKTVAADLRARFPDADLRIENRALGGFASQMLVRTAETDLYPFQPDLLIFHVFGAHDKYEDIIRRTRERTCAEILIQNDHLNSTEDWRNEETDPGKVTFKQWSSFMNYGHLPALARRYGTGFVDQRAVWKRYLADFHLEAPALLRDGIHLNARGEFLMAECVKASLKVLPGSDPTPAEAWIKTLEIGRDAQWVDGRLRVEFEGNRVDVRFKPGVAAGAPASVRIDGRKPSEFPELHGFSRALSKPGGKWPVIAPIASETLPLLEDWTLEATRDPADEKLFSFTLSGSKTGPDGEGRSDAKFVSRSGRVVISPADWNVAYALALAQVKPVPEKLSVRWSVEARFADEIVAPPAGEASLETSVTLAQGLKNSRHVLEISGGAESIAALRVYRPPLARE